MVKGPPEFHAFDPSGGFSTSSLGLIQFAPAISYRSVAMKIAISSAASIAIAIAAVSSGHAAEMSKLQEEVNRIVMSSYQQPPSSGIISAESAVGGNALQLRIRVEGDGRTWFKEWGEKVCASSSLRRMLAMGGRIILLGEDATKQRRGEMAFGAEHCASIGKGIRAEEASGSAARPVAAPAPSPRPQPAPYPR